MSRNKGRRYDTEPKLNKKKVAAFIIAIIVIIMVIVSLKNLILTEGKNKDVSTLTTYISVYKDGKWGVIDNKGKEIIAPTFDEMITIPNENEDIFVCVYDVNYENNTYKTKVLNKNKKEIFTSYEMVETIENHENNNIWYENDVLRFKENGKYGLINFKGKEILKPEYTNITAMPGVNKILILEKDGKKGIFSVFANEIVADTIYLEVSALGNSHENGYIVKTTENKYGIIGNDKKIILETKYDEIKNIESKEYAVVKEDSVLKVIDRDGKAVLEKGFDSIEAINGDEFIVIKDGKYAVLNKNGNTILKNEYEDIKSAFGEFYIVKKDEKYGIISKTNQEKKVDYIYENINYIKDANFFEADKSDYTTDLLDGELNIKAESVIVSEVNLENGYIRVRKNQEYKYYNFKFEEKTNKEVLISNTLFLVKENGKYGYVNRNGEKIVDCKYDDAKEQNRFGYAAVKKDGKWGAIKSDGTVVVNPSINLDEYLYIDFIDVWYKNKDLNLDVYTK